MIKNILDVLTFKSWSGSRTKILIVLSGVFLGLHDAHLIPEAIWTQVAQYAPFALAYFGIEHADKYFTKSV